MTDQAIFPLLVAAGLGLRHALDPDHLVAVSGLAASERGIGSRNMAMVGFAWGLGHALSLGLVGIIVIMLGRNLPTDGQRVWEQVIGLLIAAIGLRILILFLTQRSHRHDLKSPPAQRRLSPAFGIGMLHGIAGTGSVTLILLPLVPMGAQLPALLIFATMTCVSMALFAGVTGWLLSGRSWPAPITRYGRLIVGAISVFFGIGYAVTA